MSESAGDRFRRIVKAWREEESTKSQEKSPPPPTPSTPRHASQPKQPVQPTAQPVSTPPPAPQPVQPARSSTPPSTPPTPAPQATKPPTPASKSAPVSQVEWPGRAKRSKPSLPPVEIPPLEPTPDLDKIRTPADARRFLEKLRAKAAQVVQDYTNGVINQRQFQAVYSHYQRQRLEIEEALIQMPGSGVWRAAAVEGHTTFLRQQHAAQVVGYTIYETESGKPVAQVGDFDLDDASLVSMLNSFRSSTQELFSAGMKRTEIEGGRFLCFVLGRYTTLVVLYSTEPASVQLETIEDLHRDFELVNDPTLSGGDVSQRALTFTHLWAFEQEPSEF